ncbi:hypothetical protein THAOC_19470 [Thalassiosira oceanica]|uniref:Uncharacterized protein n=1 Tax=Thalassiosira oceanica TaxID=159749 RepID=K0S4Q8_THAOC|nr:hypothetical protein THAOC_19470 [Thalassiosira oceanica]|eukprot:EJK60215.1 hypothetical protein THAOC_19470 [Thalassiosira oceanica]
MATVEPRSRLAQAVLRHDLDAVKRLVGSAASPAERKRIINYASRWTEDHKAYQSAENPKESTEWFDVTPLTLAVTRGNHAIVEYLLHNGADPTLKGVSIADVEVPNDEGVAIYLLPHLHVNAFAAYSESSAFRHNRDEFTNVPVNSQWLRDALLAVPAIEGYPLRAVDYNENLVKNNILHRKREEEVARALQLKQQQEIVFEYSAEYGRQRRCFSCGVLKNEYAYNRNEKRRGVEARCITCVATRAVGDTDIQGGSLAAVKTKS